MDKPRPMTEEELRWEAVGEGDPPAGMMENRAAWAEYQAKHPPEAPPLPKKQIGKCPFCLELVEALILEGNTVRRDRCSCPKCDQPIFVCRTPGCHDYAKGTSTYDHELCPDCTATAANMAAEVGKTALKVAGAVAAAVAVAAVKGKKD
jgi:hypothetical protein